MKYDILKSNLSIVCLLLFIKCSIFSELEFPIIYINFIPVRNNLQLSNLSY